MLHMSNAGKVIGVGKQSNRIRCALIVCATITTTSTFAANADQGENLVKRWCSGCHLVSADQKSARTEAPTFPSVAARSDFDRAKLAFFLLDPHPKMPNM